MFSLGRYLQSLWCHQYLFKAYIRHSKAFQTRCRDNMGILCIWHHQRVIFNQWLHRGSITQTTVITGGTPSSPQVLPKFTQTPPQSTPKPTVRSLGGHWNITTRSLQRHSKITNRPSQNHYTNFLSFQVLLAHYLQWRLCLYLVCRPERRLQSWERVQVPPLQRHSKVTIGSPHTTRSSQGHHKITSRS